jgi:hypothetical protein
LVILLKIFTWFHFDQRVGGLGGDGDGCGSGGGFRFIIDRF